MVIVRNIWQKLSNVEREVTLIATDFWIIRIFRAKLCHKEY
jgi:hypothetical protein